MNRLHISVDKKEQKEKTPTVDFSSTKGL
jgi:hypothetical protein